MSLAPIFLPEPLLERLYGAKISPRAFGARFWRRLNFSSAGPVDSREFQSGGSLFGPAGDSPFRSAGSVLPESGGILPLLVRFRSRLRPQRVSGLRWGESLRSANCLCWARR